MPTFDRYLLREFSQAIFAALVVLMMVSLGGVFADVLAISPAAACPRR
jgi:lipopolysaccharide export system permease protein